MKRSITTEWWQISPAKANELLAKNDVNRRLRPMLVDAYAGDMEKGLWDPENGETIKISQTGFLKDGQHRLAAVVKSKKTVTFMVVTGLSDKAQKTMNQGAARTAVDVLHMNGVSNASWTASVARWCLLGGEPSPELENLLKRKGSTTQIADIVDKQPDIALAAAFYNQMKAHIPGGPTALCYSWLWMHRADPAACEQFYGAMINMMFPGLGDPRKACLKALQRMEREEGITPSSKDRAIATCSVLTRSWNLWRKGEEVQTIPIKSMGRIIPPEKPI